MEKWIARDKTTLQGNFMILPIGSGGVIARVYSENNANLIVTAVNACIEINPENPLAVAESIEKAFEALKELVKASDDAVSALNNLGHSCPASVGLASEHSRQALAKAEKGAK